MRDSIWTRTTCTLAAAAMLALAGAGCETVKENPRTTGAVARAGGGALAGSQIAGKGAKTEGAAIGAAAGGVGGWIIGDQVDKNSDKNDDRARERARERERERRDRYYDNY